MKISTKAIFITLNCLTGMLVFYFLGNLGGNLVQFAIQSLPLPPPSPIRQKSVRPERDAGEPENSFTNILDKNIFDAQRKKIDKPLPSGPTKNEPLAPKVTSLRLSLVGTMIYDNTAFAFISKKGKLRNYIVFQEGDCFTPNDVKPDDQCGQNSVQLVNINDREVVLLHRNRKEILQMEELKLDFSSLAPEPESSESSPPESSAYISPEPVEEPPPTQKKPKKTEKPANPVDAGQTTFHFQREWVDEQLANFNKLLRDARVVPSIEDGKTFFKFKFIRAGSLYEKLGLRRKDIILEINGFIVDTVPKALRLLETLKSEREINLKIRREKTTIDFNYYID